MRAWREAWPWRASRPGRERAAGPWAVLVPSGPLSPGTIPPSRARERGGIELAVPPPPGSFPGTGERACDTGTVSASSPSPKAIRRWRGYLADERAEAKVYREFAARRSGEEREIFLALAEAEGRHEAHWLRLLGDQAGKPRRGSLRTRVLAWLAGHFGSVFVLALAQQ